jgi:hypothetical protein
LSEHVKQAGPFRRIAAIVGVAGAVAAGAYGLSVVAASAQTPSTTTPPATTAPSQHPKGNNDDPNCPNMGGGGYSHNNGTAPSSTPASNASV